MLASRLQEYDMIIITYLFVKLIFWSANQVQVFETGKFMMKCSIYM